MCTKRRIKKGEKTISFHPKGPKFCSPTATRSISYKWARRIYTLLDELEKRRDKRQHGGEEKADTSVLGHRIVGSGSVGLLSDYISKSNEGVGKANKRHVGIIYIYVYIESWFSKGQGQRGGGAGIRKRKETTIRARGKKLPRRGERIWDIGTERIHFMWPSIYVSYKI